MIQKLLIPLEIDLCECIEARNPNSDRRVYVRYRGVQMQLARAMKIHYHGPSTDEKLQALHNCDNQYCINPHHMRWGTAKENAHDKAETVLTDEDARQIRISKENMKELAKHYGVTPQMIGQIQTGRRRQTAPGPIRKSKCKEKKELLANNISLP